MGVNKQPDVLVVGAGPVGLMAALALHERGVAVEIIDREWRTGVHSYALALHAESVRLLDRYDLGDAARARAYPVCRIGLYEGAARRAEAVLAPAPDDLDAAPVLRQDALEALLEDALRRRGVRVRWNHELEALAPQDGAVDALVSRLEKESVGYAVAHTEWVVAEQMRLRPAFVVGADGHRSAVRRALGAAYERAGPAETYAVFEFQTDADFEHELRLMLPPETTDVAWPLPDGHCRFSFQLPGMEAPETSRGKKRVAVEIGRGRFPVLSEESLRRLLAERAPWFAGQAGPVRWRIVVRFERRLADCFGRGRLWLAGDAAHMTGPAGMQSMNVGLAEAERLAEALAGVLGKPGSAEALDQYAREQRDQWRFLLGLTGGLQPEAETEPWIRQRAGRLLACLPASGARLLDLARQLRLRA